VGEGTREGSRRRRRGWGGERGMVGARAPGVVDRKRRDTIELTGGPAEGPGGRDRAMLRRGPSLARGI